MNKGMLILLTGLIITATGCASSGPKKQALYTQAETNAMTLCIGMSDTAWTVANQKSRGVSKEKMKKQYQGRPNAQINMATVDKVYNDKFKYSWDYTVGFFKECAANMAKVPLSRSNMASYCMQNAMIAGVAHDHKSSGAPKSKAYAYFAKFNNQTVNGIIDEVYRGNGRRAETKLAVWTDCMKPLGP